MYHFQHKKILIISPQPWTHLYISKHHYAKELSKKNEVWFICAPRHNHIGFSWDVEHKNETGSLSVITYSLPLSAFFLFHAAGLYKAVNKFRVGRILKKITSSFDVCIDFGNYQLYKNTGFVNAALKIYFPVDDFENLLPSERNSSYIFSVSNNIISKFLKAEIPCTFINHGLCEEFAVLSRKALNNIRPWQQRGRIKIGYSGNLFIPFLDKKLLQTIITQHANVEFHFFGEMKFNSDNFEQNEWFVFLTTTPNIYLRGFTSPSALAKELENMDGCILCYRPDNKNYHAENSHKIFEYLSTGNVLISTPISLYKNNDLFCMSKDENNGDFPEVFAEAVNRLEFYNSEDFFRRRIVLALDNEYYRQIERMEEVISAAAND